MLLGAAVIGLGIAMVYNGQSTNRKVIGKKKKGTRAPSRNNQIYEDAMTGDLRTTMNLSAYANALDDPEVRIVRANKPEDLYDVLGNALQWQDTIREKNNTLAYETYFANPQASRKSVTLPGNYQNKPVLTMLKSEAIFPSLKQYFPFFTKMEYPDGDTPMISPTINPANYRDQMGSYTPFDFGHDNVSSVTTLGTPWGPGGIISHTMIDGGSRLDGQHDLVDYTKPDTKVKKHVHFQI